MMVERTLRQNGKRESSTGTLSDVEYDSLKSMAMNLGPDHFKLEFCKALGREEIYVRYCL